MRVNTDALGQGVCVGGMNYEKHERNERLGTVGKGEIMPLPPQKEVTAMGFSVVKAAQKSLCSFSGTIDSPRVARDRRSHPRIGCGEDEGKRNRTSE